MFEKGSPALGIATAVLTAAALGTEPTTIEDGVRVHSLESEYQAGGVEVRVLVPDRIASDHRVLYVLPVESGTTLRWGDPLAVIRGAKLQDKHGLVCVYPTFSALPWYADHPTDAAIRQESHFLRAVVPLIEQSYPVRAEPSGRLLIGFSKSGWGAWSLMLRHPATFHKAAAWDSPMMMVRPDKYGMGPIFGTVSNFEDYRIDRLLRERADRLQDSERIGLFGYGSFREQHQQVHALMESLGIRHAYRDGPGREHSWTSGWLPEAVDWLATE